LRKGFKKAKLGGGNLTQERYIREIFKPYIIKALRAAQAEGRDFLLQEDND
jgi:hypothetical protein